jgi:putative tryptophan/tyrosine transport system ATP-binding protein
VTCAQDWLQLHDLVVSFTRWGQKVNALNGVNLSITKNEWVMLLGPNGSGKTTLLKVICGRTPADRGSVVIDRHSLNSLSLREWSQFVFYVDQNPLRGTAPHLSVFENLYVSDVHGQRASKRTLHARYAEMLEPLGLHERLGQPAGTLSGGQRQLLALLIARLQPGSIVLLDEPLAALDPAKGRICFEEITRLHATGKTVIQVTHSQEHGVTAGNRTVVLVEGRVAYDAHGNERSLSDLDQYFFPTAASGMTQ